jgi:hypothetical protein
MLNLIQGTKKPEKPKPPYAMLYLEAFSRMCECLMLQQVNDKDVDNLDVCRAIFYGVKYFGIVDNDDLQLTYESAEDTLYLVKHITSLIGQLTPRQLTRIFPIEKRYDGEKWGMKDYFYAMEALEEHGMDTPIGEAVEDIFWVFVNRDIRKFAIFEMNIIGRLYRAMTGKSMFSEFFNSTGTEHNITTYTKKTCPTTGKEYILNNDTGQTSSIIKPKPRHLRLLD